MVSEFHALDLSIGLVGLGLTVMGIAFATWANRLKQVLAMTMTIEKKIVMLATDFHAHQLEIERRISHLESKITN